MPGRKGMNAIHAAGSARGYERWLSKQRDAASPPRAAACSRGWRNACPSALPWWRCPPWRFLSVGCSASTPSARSPTNRRPSARCRQGRLRRRPWAAVRRRGAAVVVRIRRRHVHSVVEFRRFITGLGPERRCSVVRLVGRRRFRGAVRVDGFYARSLHACDADRDVERSVARGVRSVRFHVGLNVDFDVGFTVAQARDDVRLVDDLVRRRRVVHGNRIQRIVASPGRGVFRTCPGRSGGGAAAGPRVRGVCHADDAVPRASGRVQRSGPCASAGRGTKVAGL